MPSCQFNIKRGLFTLIWLLPILFVLFTLFGDRIANDLRLWQIARQLNALPSPSHTIQISSHAAVGLLVGNGNHCDFFAGTVYRSQNSKDAIQRHYKGFQFQNPVTGESEDLEVTILSDASSLNSVWLPYAFDHPDAWGLTSASYSSGTLFLVHVMRSYDANRDWRCH